MALDLNQQELYEIANIFATAFKDQGLFGGGAGDADGENTSKKRAAQATADKKEKTDKENVKTTGKLTDKLKTLGGSVYSFENALRAASSNVKALFSIAALTRGITQGVDDFSTQLQQGAISTGGAMDQMVRSIGLFVDPQVLSNLQNQNRAAVIAMGGVESWAGSMDEVQKTMFRYTGDTAAALELASESFQTMRMVGIDPTIDMLVDAQKNLTGFGRSMRDIGIMTKMNMKEVNEMMQGFVKTDEVRRRILGNQSRRAVLEDIAGRQALLVTMGYMQEEAQRAGESLDKLAGESPKDRMKKAAQAMAALGAAGMGREAGEVRKMLLLGDREGGVGTKKGAERMAKIMGEYQERIAQSRLGSKGDEFFQAAVYEKLGMSWSEPYMNLAKEEQKARLKDTRDNKDTAGENNKLLTDILFYGKGVKNAIFDNPMMALMTGLIGTSNILLGLILGQGGMFGGLKGLGIKGIMSKFLISPLKWFGKLLLRAGAIGGLILSGMSVWEGFSEEFSKKSNEGVSGFFEALIKGFANLGDDIFGFFGKAGAQAKKEMGEDLRVLFDMFDWIREVIPNWMGGKDSIAAQEMAAVRDSNLKRARDLNTGIDRDTFRATTMAASVTPKDFNIDQLFGVQKAFQQQLVQRAANTDNLMNLSENNELLNIATLLDRLNINAENAQKLTRSQLEVLAEIAEDGKITNEELEKGSTKATLQMMRM